MRGKGGRPGNYLFSGLAKCGYCGSLMYHTNKVRHLYLSCSNRECTSRASKEAAAIADRLEHAEQVILDLQRKPKTKEAAHLQAARPGENRCLNSCKGNQRCSTGAH